MDGFTWKVKSVTLEELNWPEDCEFCRTQVELAKRIDAMYVLVDIETGHVIGVVARYEDCE